jgi:hypothetical protein
MCQLMELEHAFENPSWFEKMRLWCLRAVRFGRNRLHYLRHGAGAVPASRRRSGDNRPPGSLNLRPGESVRIKSREAIGLTLDGWKRYEGCQFMDVMYDFCGQNGRVMKRVNVILDERSMKLKKCRNMVILEDMICHGSWPFGECDKSCYFMWKEAWLEKIE